MVDATNRDTRSPEAEELSFKAFLALHLITSFLAFAAAWLVFTRLELAAHWSGAGKPLCMVAFIVALLPGLYRRRQFARCSARICIFISTLLLLVACVEVSFRLVGFDFRRQASLLRQVAPFWQKPRVPTGDVFFRRLGPMTWTGQVLRGHLEAYHMASQSYRDEPVVTVHYNHLGFRNDDGLTAWDLAVAGDSFTELGHLPADQLFTTLLGRRLGLRVLNLGVSYTGPLTYLSYLQDYGLCPEVRATLVVFYEGNDMEDIRREYTSLMQFQKTGQRPRRDIREQTSLLRALGEHFHRAPAPSGSQELSVDAFFRSSHGRVPVTLEPPPKSGADQPEAALRALTLFATNYAAFGRQHHVNPWLIYMPCKQRVWHGRLEFSNATPPSIKDWQPTDLPAVVAAECARNGVGFIDLTPMLREVTERTGDMLFNALYDTHLNAQGSEVVAGALAVSLQGVGSTQSR